jgi:hypothetical protein
MKKILLLTLGCGFLMAHAQDAADTTKPVNPWTFRLATALTVSQTSFTNWQAGGENTLASNLLIQSNINYNKGLHSWENLILGNLGMVSREAGSFKTDDRFEINSRYDRKFSKHWNFSALGNFRTQFMDGFKNIGDSNRISTFLAPGYGIAALGVTYKVEKKINFFLSPLTAKTTWVRDQTLSDAGAFGVEPGQMIRYEAGGYLNFIYQDQFLESKKIDFLTKFDLFSNYLENPLAIDVNWETIIFYKINKYFTVNVAFHLIYDEDIRFNLDTNGDGNIDAVNVPRTQFRNMLGFGLSYTFSNK